MILYGKNNTIRNNPFSDQKCNDDQKIFFLFSMNLFNDDQKCLLVRIKPLESSWAAVVVWFRLTVYS